MKFAGKRVTARFASPGHEYGVIMSEPEVGSTVVTVKWDSDPTIRPANLTCLVEVTPMVEAVIAQKVSAAKLLEVFCKNAKPLTEEVSA